MTRDAATTVVAVDLGYRDHRDFGIALLERSERGLVVIPHARLRVGRRRKVLAP